MNDFIELTLFRSENKVCLRKSCVSHFYLSEDDYTFENFVWIEMCNGDGFYVKESYDEVKDLIVNNKRS